MKLHISAVICTHNRANYLRKAIRSLVNQTLPKEEYEILVIDNASTDNTREIILGEFSHISNLRYIYENKLGANHARNIGLANSAGKYVAYLDDDAIASDQWLEKILNVLHTCKPTVGCVGGRVELIWESVRPLWLSNELLGWLAMINWTAQPAVLSGTQYLASVNIAFPKRLLEDMGGFDPRLGRRGSNLLSNDEILIQRQLQSRGYELYYDPSIVVSHHVSASRLNRKWFVRRAFWQGVSDIKMQQILCPPKSRELLQGAVAHIRKIMKDMCGGHIFPAAVYNHIRAMKLGAMMSCAYGVGIVVQAIREALRDYAASLRMRLLNHLHNLKTLS